jgi:hypothetical protein
MPFESSYGTLNERRRVRVIVKLHICSGGAQKSTKYGFYIELRRCYTFGARAAPQKCMNMHTSIAIATSSLTSCRDTRYRRLLLPNTRTATQAGSGPRRETKTVAVAGRPASARSAKLPSSPQGLRAVRSSTPLNSRAALDTQTLRLNLCAFHRSLSPSAASLATCSAVRFVTSSDPRLHSR